MCILCGYFMLLWQHGMLLVHVTTDKHYTAEFCTIQNDFNKNFFSRSYTCYRSVYQQLKSRSLDGYQLLQIGKFLPLKCFVGISFVTQHQLCFLASCGGGEENMVHSSHMRAQFHMHKQQEPDSLIFSFLSLSGLTFRNPRFNPLHPIVAKCACEISCPLHSIAAKCARTSLPLFILIAAPFSTWGQLLRVTGSQSKHN